MSDEIKWPERPTVHTGMPHCGEQSWRPAGVKLHPSNDHVPAFRTCSYCGSIHPEDLITAIEAGAVLGGADWKYGWPHKFYVSKIPNPNAGNMVSMGGTSRRENDPMTEEARLKAGYSLPVLREELSQTTIDGVVVSTNVVKWLDYKLYQPDSVHTHAKWYNEHLQELSQEAFAKLAPLLEKHSGIRFEYIDGKLAYAAPSAGYQR